MTHVLSGNAGDILLNFSKLLRSGSRYRVNFEVLEEDKMMDPETGAYFQEKFLDNLDSAENTKPVKSYESVDDMRKAFSSLA